MDNGLIWFDAVTVGWVSWNVNLLDGMERMNNIAYFMMFSPTDDLLLLLF